MKITAVHVQRNWWKYLLVLVASILIWSIVFDSLAVPSKNEKIRITFLGENLDHEAFEEYVAEILPGLTNQRIEKVDVENPVDEINNDFYMVLTTRVYGADIIIVEESLLTEDICQAYFVPLPLETLEKHMPVSEVYVENGQPYGLLLPSGDGAGLFGEFYSGTERCYLFITHTSVNVAGILGTGNEVDDAALKLICHLLEGK